MATDNYMFLHPQTIFQDIIAPDGRVFMDTAKEFLDDYLLGSVEVPDFDFGDVELLEDPLNLLLPLPLPLPCAEQVRKDDEAVLEADSLSNLLFLPPPPLLMQSREEARRLEMSQGPINLGISEKASGDVRGEKGGYLGSTLHAHPLEIESSALSIRRRIYGTADTQAIDCIKMGHGCVALMKCNHSRTVEASYKVGRYTVEERKQRIERYKMKRNARNFSKKIKVLPSCSPFLVLLGILSPTQPSVISASPSSKLSLCGKEVVRSVLVERIMAKEGGKEVEQGSFVAKDYIDPPPAPFFDVEEFRKWSFYRALIAEFIATLLFLYITVATVIGHKRNSDGCGSVGILGIAWAFGGMIFVLVYCTAGISGGHINPAVTFGLFLARKVSFPRAVLYMVAQCLGAICGCGLVKAFQKSFYDRYGGGANTVAHGYTKGVGLGAEIIGTFVLVYTVFSATDPKRSARDSHVPVLAPLPIGFAVFMVHLATIPITGTGINPARSFGAAVIYGHQQPWDDHWIFWVGPFLGAAAAAAYHQYILRAAAIKALGSFRSNPQI